VVCLVDTPAPTPASALEERGQAESIARNLMEMSRLKTPIITVITGEGAAAGRWVWRSPTESHARVRLVQRNLARGVQRHSLEGERKRRRCGRGAQTHQQNT